MPDKWEKYAAPSAPSSKWDQFIVPASSSPNKPKQGFLSSAAESSGLTGLANSVLHPIETLTGIPGAIKGIVGNTADNISKGVADYKKGGLSLETRRDFGRAVPIIGPTLAKAQEQQDSGDTGGAIGTLGGFAAGVAAPAVIPKVIPSIGRAVAGVGEAAQDSGVGLINKTIGTLKNDFKRGANPGRGYFESGGGPAVSMASLADKSSAALGLTGKNIGKVVDAATAAGVKTTPESVALKLQRPLAKAVDLETGPGGMGNTTAIENYSAGFRPAIKEAVVKGGFSPREIMDIKTNIAQNTNWSDPTQFNLKAVRQQQTGALGGSLKAAVPEYGPLAETYGDLKKFAARAQTRAETGSQPLTHLAGKGVMSGIGTIAGYGAGGPKEAILGGLAGIAADSVPVKSTLASGLYYGGKGLEAVGDGIQSMPVLDPARVAVPAYTLVGKKRKENNE